jgi:hypothetical protein
MGHEMARLGRIGNSASRDIWLKQKTPCGEIAATHAPSIEMPTEPMGEGPKRARDPIRAE